MPKPNSLSNDNLRSMLNNLQQNLSQQENEAAAEIKKLISTIDRLFTRDSSGQLPVLQGETLETIKNDYKSAFKRCR